MNIPIRNIYYLLLYAWEHVQHLDEADVVCGDHTELQDMLATALTHEIGRLLARGLSREYVALEGPVAGVRGKIDVAATVKTNLRARAQTYCHFDEMQYDVPRNRVLRGTLKRLLELRRLSPGVREDVWMVYRKLDGISDRIPSRRALRAVARHRNVRGYDLALELCRLINASLMIDRASGGTRFRDFRQDRATMWRLFEDFLLGFYEKEQSRYRAKRENLEWHEATESRGDLSALPRMRLDLLLESPDRCIIVEVKFYPRAMQEHYGKERLRSAHLYQLFTYIENRAASRPDLPHEGLLLYPVLDRPLSFSYRLKGRRLNVKSIDLSQDWRHIRRDLLELVA